VEIKTVLREYLQQQHAAGADGFELTDSTPLLSCGVLDSIAVMQLLMFIEATFEIEFVPRDLDRRRLDTIDQLEDLVRRKLAERGTGRAVGAGDGR
jgi:acyl carrier protein